ncbi:MFS transporter [Streptomyces nogalater]
MVRAPARRTLIDLRFFRSAPFSGATVIAISAFAALGGFLFLSTLYLQNVRGLDALHAGLWMLPMAVPILLCAPLSGRLVGSRGPRASLLVAGVAMTASGVLFAAFEAETENATLLLGYVLFGIGFGFVNAPITNTAVSGMPRAQAGSPPPSPPPAGSWARRSASRWSARSWPPASARRRTGRRSSPRPVPAGGSSPAAAWPSWSSAC